MTTVYVMNSNHSLKAVNGDRQLCGHTWILETLDIAGALGVICKVFREGGLVLVKEAA